MKWFILLYVVNIYSASLLDQSVSSLEQLNGDITNEVLSMCMQEQISSNCKNTKSFDAKIASKYLVCTNGKKYNNKNLDNFFKARRNR